MNKPTLSILISNYNHGEYISEALDSILKQSFRPIEILITDDASNDNSAEIINRFADQYPIIHLTINKKNMGFIHNTNKLMKLAKGDCILIAASDDRWLPGIFEKSINLLGKFPGAGLSSALVYTINKRGENLGIYPSPILSLKPCYFTPEEATVKIHRYGQYIIGMTTIYRRKYLLETGGYNPELYSYCDKFLTSVIAMKYGACFIPEPLAERRIGLNNINVQMNSNPEIRLAMINNAGKLMRSTDLFSSEYVDNWENKQLCYLTLKTVSEAHKKMIDNIKTCFPPNQLFAKGFFRFLDILMRSNSFFVRLYMATRINYNACLLLAGKLKIKLNYLIVKRKHKRVTRHNKNSI